MFTIDILNGTPHLFTTEKSDGGVTDGLVDEEFGTWTPMMTSTPIINTLGTWQRIGSRVFVDGFVVIAGQFNNVPMAGLPFLRKDFGFHLLSVGAVINNVRTIIGSALIRHSGITLFFPTPVIGDVVFSLNYEIEQL